ncbi:hypothetical protein XENTR_v10011210 [Xenopus tropicalis]|nr:hypothetical protein XENTR_v10011210 [Xenopus tropicalis]
MPRHMLFYFLLTLIYCQTSWHTQLDVMRSMQQQNKSCPSCFSGVGTQFCIKVPPFSVEVLLFSIQLSSWSERMNGFYPLSTGRQKSYGIKSPKH